jgi:three-Cys-motif partner protein
MASFKPTALWEAPPHTLAKLEIIGRYLDVWFKIMSSNPHNRRLVYIDGFAGPGRYTNSEKSSPLVALQAAKAAVNWNSSTANAVEYSFLFVEKKPDFAENLREVVKNESHPQNLKWSVEQGSFEDKVGGLLANLKAQGKQLAPTFAFIDPFGATGLPFNVIAEILSYKSCEVLLNLDSDGIGRLVTAQSFEKNQTHLDTLFGDTAWRAELNPTVPMQKLSAQVLALYKRRLKTVAKYVFAFAMNSKVAHLNYHLVFASQHPLGLEKMKEAMKAVDQTGNYSFSDDTVGQELLRFDFDAPKIWADRMRHSLAGKWRPYADFRDYALNETPFMNPKSMLRELETQGVLDLEATPERKKGSFPEDKIIRLFAHQTLL